MNSTFFEIINLDGFAKSILNNFVTQHTVTKCKASSAYCIKSVGIRLLTKLSGLHFFLAFLNVVIYSTNAIQ